MNKHSNSSNNYVILNDKDKLLFNLLSNTLTITISARVLIKFIIIYCFILPFK